MSARPLILLILAFLVALMWAFSLASRRLEHVASGVMPLDARRFDSLELVTLGTGGTHENHLRLGPSVAVGLGETVVLVDAGRALAQALRAAEIPVAQPRTLLLTSLLPENTLGLDDWMVTAALDPGRDPLRVVGPIGTRDLVDGLRRAHAAGERAQLEAYGLPAAPEVRVEEVSAESGWQGEAGGLALRARPLSQGPLPALAWRVEGGDRSVVVAGTGWDGDGVVALARGADVLVTGAISGEALDQALAADLEGREAISREARLHLRLEEAGALATRAEVGTLVVVRLRPPPVLAFRYASVIGQAYRGRVVVAGDGETIVP